MTLDAVDFVAVFAAVGIVGAIAALASWKVGQKFVSARVALEGKSLEQAQSIIAQKADFDSQYFASQLEQLRVLVASRPTDALHPALLGLLAQRQGGCCGSRSGLTIVELRDGLTDLVKVNEALASVNGPDGWQKLQTLLSSDGVKSLFTILGLATANRGLPGLPGLPLPPGFAPGPCPGCGKPPAVPPPGAVVAQSIEEAKRLHEQMQAAAAKATEALPPTPPIVEAPAAPIVAEPPKLDTGGASGVGSAATSGVPSTATNGPQPA